VSTSLLNKGIVIILGDVCLIINQLLIAFIAVISKF